MKVLWLASWYPNKLSPYNGDFIKRHAEAVSLFEDVQVIHVMKDERGEVTKEVLKEISGKGRLTETIIYYKSPGTGFTLLDKILSERKYRKLFRRAIEDYVADNGNPSLVHVHVGMKVGVMALWMKKKWRVPYVVTEHWSGFLSEAKEKFSDLSFYLQNTWKKVMTGARGCSAVSAHLAKAIQQYFPGLNCRIIPNVVNTEIFFPAPQHYEHPRFIHISGLDELKNPAHILRAFQIVRQNFPLAQLEIFGSVRHEIVQLAGELGLQSSVSFSEEVPQPVLAKHINRSAALILYSSYETFGCVIIEANACGVPVIVSDIPTFHETVTEAVNGVFAKADDPASLAKKMIDVIKNRSSFDSTAIATMTGSRFGYETVGKQISHWYHEIVQPV